MYYRRKIILALIELLGNEVEKIRFQKLLFLFAMKKTQPEYDFIPYKFGCYSYSAKADMNTMVKKGFFSESETLYIKEDTMSYLTKLNANDQKLLRQTVMDYGSMSNSALIKHTYINYPFYAIKSTIAKEVLPAEFFKRIENQIPENTETTLFTIGYEGISLEKYLRVLIENNVKLLVDVRRNPLSMKFGFSKTLLKKYCNSLDIEYVHIPELGIASESRQELVTQADYDKLFAQYCKTTLQETIVAQKQLLQMLKKHKRIGLTCFEADPCQCHRSHLAHALSQQPEFHYPLIHL